MSTAPSQAPEVDFDVIVIGAGIAGCVSAYQLASRGHSVLVVERGPAPGAKNLSGGVFYCRVMEQVFPDFLAAAPIERRIVRNCLSFLTSTGFVNVDYRDSRLAEPVNAVTVLRSKLDAWLAERCEEAGAVVMPGVAVDGLLRDGERIVGVRADGDELRCHVVITADGVNSFIAQGAGIRAPEPPKHLAVGVKSVIGLPRRTIEDRFGLTGDEGAAYAIVGQATSGIGGGGFLYTNTDSISIGVVLRLDDLASSDQASADIHDAFLAHPAIVPFLAEGELLEYGCHLVAEGGKAMVHDLVRPGLVVVGDAAGFTLNTGFTIRGMDLAAGSGIAAASAVDAALVAGDFSEVGLSAYEAALARSFVGQDMDTYARAPGFFENPRLYGAYGELLADVLHGIYDLDTTPRRHLLATARSALKRSDLSIRRLAQDGLKALKAL